MQGNILSIWGGETVTSAQSEWRETEELHQQSDLAVGRELGGCTFTAGRPTYFNALYMYVTKRSNSQVTLLLAPAGDQALSRWPTVLLPAKGAVQGRLTMRIPGGNLWVSKRAALRFGG